MDIIKMCIISTALDATEGIFAVLYVSIMGLHVVIKRQFFCIYNMKPYMAYNHCIALLPLPFTSHHCALDSSEQLINSF